MGWQHAAHADLTATTKKKLTNLLVFRAAYKMPRKIGYLSRPCFKLSSVQSNKQQQQQLRTNNTQYAEFYAFAKVLVFVVFVASLLPLRHSLLPFVLQFRSSLSTSWSAFGPLKCATVFKIVEEKANLNLPQDLYLGEFKIVYIIFIYFLHLKWLNESFIAQFSGPKSFCQWLLLKYF